MTRRGLLAAGLFAATVAFIPGGRFLLDWSPAQHLAGIPPLHAFTAHLGSVFTVDPGRQLSLVGADPGRTPGADAYSLLFRAPRGAEPLQGRIHRLRHPALGKFELFLSPVGRAVHGQGYEAVISKSVPNRKGGRASGFANAR
ncbi:MAG: hypothetical protein QOH95_1582 [Gaiellaceae bacterium]|nr:hypothetical protein [Gaiellaceae bacterium]